MKKLITVLTLLAPFYCFAQIPMGLNYQAIAWDKFNLPKALKSITITVNILKGPNEKTDIEFTETQTATTNELGLFTITIGSVNPNGFQAINWAAIPKYLHVIIDGIPSAPTPMLSVPYAMYAENTTLKAGMGIAVSGNTISNAGDADNDPKNELQNLSLEGDRLKLSKDGGEVPILTTLKAGTGIAVSGNTISNAGDADNDPKNELQNLSLEGDLLKLSDGGSVELSKISQTSFKILSNPFSFSRLTFGVDLPGMNITIPQDGIYSVHASASVNIPTDSNPDDVFLQLRVDSYYLAIIRDDVGGNMLSGFFIGAFKKNEVVQLKMDALYSSFSSMGTVDKAYLLVQKIQ